MANDELHYPPGAEPKAPEPEAPKDEPKPAEAPAPKEDTPPAPKPEEKPEEKPADKPDTPEVPLPKPRSIYDDLKDKKHELKEAKTELEQLKERNTELEALVQAGKDAKTPEEKSEAADDIKAYAEKHKLDADALNELVGVVSKRIPASKLPDDVARELSDLKSWKATEEAKAKRTEEDTQILASAAAVKIQLEIHDDAELAKVMKEVVKLAHSEAFHDKEVEYIVWKNKDALSKMVSPKKPSFESGGTPGAEAEAKEVDFNGKMTPAAAQKAVESSYPKGQLEIRRGS